MPVVIANLKPHTLAEIRRLVDAGHYASVAEFVELAAANQLELEKERVRGSGPAASATPSAQPVASRQRPETQQTRVIDVEIRRSPGAGADARSGRVTRAGDEGSLQTLASLRIREALEWPAELAVKPPPPSTDGWIWGQINRLLPLKVAIRWLALFGGRERTWPTVDEALDALGAEAAAVGTALERADTDAGRMRDELLATGLPRRGNPLSIDRFLSQYLVRTTRKGVVHSGAAIQYGLAVLERDRLALSGTGLQLATLRNPVLDGSLEDAKDALSAEERQFFVRHAVPLVSTELRDFALIASFVEGGRNTPTEVAELHREHLPADWSDTMVRTHVTGAVARMVDLGLLRRVWQGRHVQYEACPLAGEIKRLHLHHSEGSANG